MKISKLLLLISLSCALTAKVQGQAANNNPTGPGGAFNGNVTTAGSYDPFTANVNRTVTDMVVDGAVGTIPLSLTRIYNSRGFGSTLFGNAAGWQHNYNWGIDDSEEGSSQALPTSHTVHFPDGRVTTFGFSSSDTYYRAGLGVTERFIPFNGTTLLGYLLLTDGSKVEFKAKKISLLDGETGVHSYYYTFKAQAIIDPHGLRTTFTYNTDDTLQKVTESAGRYIQFYYVTLANRKTVDHVTSSDGRTVQYYYVQGAVSPGTTSYVRLDHIVYFGNAQWTATYKYRTPNTGSANGTPLLWTCDDPMYEGPMKRIGYTYATANNADGTAPVYGQILSENYYDGTNVGVAVSSLSINGSTRTETRGDSKTRTFTYTSYKLTSETDFKGVSASNSYDTNYYISSVTDRNGRTTDLARNTLTGAVTQTTFPATQNTTLPSGSARGFVKTTYGWGACPDVNNRDTNNPYYPYSVTDEAGNETKFTRDTNKRITRIDYLA